MDRVVCYGATRNIYDQLVPTLRSLTAHTKVDRIYVMAEDDRLGFVPPKNVTVLNVSGQRIFDPAGPNYNSRWTWMVLMKAALTKVLPVQEHKALMLDVDTVIQGDIGGLWDYDLTGNYLAGVREPYWTALKDRLYVNMGVALFDLDAMRADGTDDRIIAALNEKRYALNEQDCINEICAGHILEIPSEYNVCPFTPPTQVVRIRHYAGDKGWFDRAEVAEWKIGGTK